mgnify:CR=1 FL=1
MKSERRKKQEKKEEEEEEQEKRKEKKQIHAIPGYLISATSRHCGILATTTDPGVALGIHVAVARQSTTERASH